MIGSNIIIAFNIFKKSINAPIILLKLVLINDNELRLEDKKIISIGHFFIPTLTMSAKNLNPRIYLMINYLHCNILGFIYTIQDIYE